MARYRATFPTASIGTPDPPRDRHLRRPLPSSSTVLRQTNCLRATDFVGYAFPACECAAGRVGARDFVVATLARRCLPVSP